MHDNRIGHTDRDSELLNSGGIGRESYRIRGGFRPTAFRPAGVSRVTAAKAWHALRCSFLTGRGVTTPHCLCPKPITQ